MITYGANGWYWEMSNGKYGVVINSLYMLKSHFPSAGHMYVKGYERLFYFTKEEFINRRILHILKVDHFKQDELRQFHDKMCTDSPKKPL